MTASFTIDDDAVDAFNNVIVCMFITGEKIIDSYLSLLPTCTILKDKIQRELLLSDYLFQHSFFRRGFVHLFLGILFVIMQLCNKQRHLSKINCFMQANF